MGLEDSIFILKDLSIDYTDELNIDPDYPLCLLRPLSRFADLHTDAYTVAFPVVIVAATTSF